MSMTLAAAKTYVAGILGGQDDPNLVVAAGTAILAAAAKWNTHGQDWSYLLKDTSNGFAIPLCTATGGTVITSTSLAIQGINVGVTVTLLAGAGSIPANTTVLSITKNTYTGAVQSCTLSAAVTGAGTGLTLAVSGDIPVVSGTQNYNAPVDFGKPYLARLLTNQRVLKYIKQREVQRKLGSLTNGGIPTHYSVYNPNGFDATSEHSNVALFRIPSAADTLRLFYYRNIDGTADPVDVPTEFLFPFLHLAQFELVRSKNGDDSRLATLASIAASELEDAQSDDITETEDEDLRMLSQMEVGDRELTSYSIWDDLE